MLTLNFMLTIINVGKLTPWKVTNGALKSNVMIRRDNNLNYPLLNDHKLA